MMSPHTLQNFNPGVHQTSLVNGQYTGSKTWRLVADD